LRRHLRRLVGRRVIVITRHPDDRSVRGVLKGVYADCVVVAAPEYLGEPQPAKMDGEVVVLMGNVALVQDVAA
jgi:small nuclear ribonucleoprotein (snRNP)-like protein